MVNEEDKLTYDDLVEEHKIDSYKNLLDIINIDNDEDIRENFIFRGLKKTSYDLIPSALRYDNIICLIKSIEQYELRTKKLHRIIRYNGKRRR